MSMLLKPSSCFLLTVGSVRCNRKCPEVTVVVNLYFINNTEFNWPELKTVESSTFFLFLLFFNYICSLNDHYSYLHFCHCYVVSFTVDLQSKIIFNHAFLLRVITVNDEAWQANGCPSPPCHQKKSLMDFMSWTMKWACIQRAWLRGMPRRKDESKVSPKQETETRNKDQGEVVQGSGNRAAL